MSYIDDYPLRLRGEYARLSAEMDGPFDWEEDEQPLKWWHYAIAAPLYPIYLFVCWCRGIKP